MKQHIAGSLKRRDQGQGDTDEAFTLGTKFKEFHRHREQSYGCQGGGEVRGRIRSLGFANANYYI